MRWLLALLFALPLVTAANTVIVENGTNYTVEDRTYLLVVVNENATILSADNSSSILRKDICRTLTYTDVCLTSVSGTKATIEENFLGPILTAQHVLDVNSAEIDSEATGRVTLVNTGEYPARQATIIIQFPSNLFLDNGTHTFSWSGQVTEEVSIPYSFTSLSNGSSVISGYVVYHDGNQTKNLTLTNRTFSATIPFTYKVGYDPNTSFDDTQLSVNVTKTASENLTFTIIAELPQQAIITSVTEGAEERGSRIEERDQLNSTDTKAELEVLYHFIAPPTRPLRITIQYDNGSADRSITQAYDYAVFEDEGAPAIAIKADPLAVNRTSQLTVVITGNRTGTLRIASDILNYTGNAGAGENPFPVTPTNTGNYTVSFVYTTEGAYGEPYEATGEIVLTVLAELPKPVVNQTVSENQTVTEPEIETTEQTGTPRSALMIAGAAAVALLLVLLVLIHKMRNPLSRVEQLVETVIELRKAVEARSRGRQRTHAEEEELAALQRELDALNKKL